MACVVHSLGTRRLQRIRKTEIGSDVALNRDGQWRGIEPDGWYGWTPGMELDCVVGLIDLLVWYFIDLWIFYLVIIHIYPLTSAPTIIIVLWMYYDTRVGSFIHMSGFEADVWFLKELVWRIHSPCVTTQRERDRESSTYVSTEGWPFKTTCMACSMDAQYQHILKACS